MDFDNYELKNSLFEMVSGIHSWVPSDWCGH